MNIKNIINTILNNIKVKNQYAIFPYTKNVYTVVLILKSYCIKCVYLIDSWILIYFNYNTSKKNLSIKTFNLKNKKNYYTYLRLKNLYFKHKDGIIFTNKGICSLSKAIELKIGGILFCLIYYSN